MNEAYYVVCHNGVFVLPDAIYHSLASFVRHNLVYVREDEDALLISSTRIADGHRRVLHTRFRSPMLRNARQLAIVDLKEAIRVMPVT
jgi:hypothetical protein